MHPARHTDSTRTLCSASGRDPHCARPPAAPPPAPAPARPPPPAPATSPATGGGIAPAAFWFSNAAVSSATRLRGTPPVQRRGCRLTKNFSELLLEKGRNHLKGLSPKHRKSG